ncbi:hypothetical protein [Amycolatopsis albispora]|uniref:Uncharacterized protein n=1 Tax=Amycolatopsis albispora TaxID=1804986 RepID=A0A344L0U1_9PSEU|nr:hypothetical protein [Amycolatopsis albispora]AXB41665.1 hypothetical protein A4R43_03315 [Amycolatopsis albispora]
MISRRWRVPVVIACGVLAAAAVGVTVWLSRDEPFEPGAPGYLDLACGLHLHQRDLNRAAIEADDAEQQLGYAVSTLFLEVGNRELNTRLQDLSNELKVALDEDNDAAFDQARARADAECGERDAFAPEPGALVEVACGIADVLEPGPGPELLLTSSLISAAAERDAQYEELDKAAARLVLDPASPLDANHPDAEEIAAFRNQCPA